MAEGTEHGEGDVGTAPPVLARRRRRAILGASVTAVLLLGAAWVLTRPSTERLCMGGLLVTPGPTDGSPEHALDAWWDAGGAAGLPRRDPAVGVPANPARDDLARRGSASWAWVHGDGLETRIETTRSGDGWAVTGVSECTVTEGAGTADQLLDRLGGGDRGEVLTPGAAIGSPSVGGAAAP